MIRLLQLFGFRKGWVRYRVLHRFRDGPYGGECDTVVWATNPTDAAVKSAPHDTLMEKSIVFHPGDTQRVTTIIWTKGETKHA